MNDPKGRSLDTMTVEEVARLTDDEFTELCLQDPTIFETTQEVRTAQDVLRLVEAQLESTRRLKDIAELATGKKGEMLRTKETTLSFLSQDIRRSIAKARIQDRERN